MPELRIGINPRDAEAGAKRVQAALDRVSGSARKTVGATKKVETGFEKMKGAANRLKGALAALGLAVSALVLAKLAASATLLAARYETLGVVMNQLGRNVGKTASQMAALEKSLQETGISAIEARNNIARMVGAQLDLADATDLARIAQDAAVIAGIDSSAAFERLVTGISTGQVRILRTMGLFVDFAAAIDAAADAAGRSADSFTEMERTQIRANAILAGAGQIAGAYEAALETAGKELGSMRRHVSNLMVALGDTAMPTFTTVVFTLSAKIKELHGFVERNKETLTFWVTNLADAFFALAAALIVVGTAWAGLAIGTWLATLVPLTAGLWGMAAGAGGLGLAFQGMFAAMGPVGWVVLGITAISTAVFVAIKAFKAFGEEVKSLGSEDTTRMLLAFANAGTVIPGAPGAIAGPALGRSFDPLTADFLRESMNPLTSPLNEAAVVPPPAGFTAPEFTPEKSRLTGIVGGNGAPDRPGRLGGMLSGAMDTLGEGMSALWAKFGPAGLAIAALFDIVSAALKPLQPVIDALREPLKIIGTLIGQNLAPVLELLVPIINALAKAFTFGQQAFGYLVQALGWLIDHLVPDFISKVGKGIEQYGKDMVENSKAARRALSATNDFSDALTAATVNIPRALPLAFLRQQAGRNNPSTGVGTGTGTGTGTGNGVGGGNGDEKESSGSRTSNFNIVVNGSVSPRETAQAVMDEIRRAKGSGQSIELDRHYARKTG